ncbi:Uu.00g104980.m01.CDS01 [Anthostomella pinea]|uniref:Uu.00g104980.m01.CDS01 n=1 Tax=Anthostomella pinea TaxID=933095 RepID=A0AAI8YFR9_9PEZI|nr:Uu.00g104980.m01.CDS01 [Anthostomella pinea]
MASGSSLADVLRLPKLGHKKSMFGCQRCRKRRVKCNEAKPICHNCERHQLPCVYDRAAGGLRSPQSSSSSSSFLQGTHSRQSQEREEQSYLAGALEGDDPPDGRTRRLLEVRLMHQYVTDTSISIAVDEVSRGIFVEAIPKHAFESDAMLYGMYSMAALHLAIKGGEDSPVFREAARKYFSMAIREHNKEISQLTKETVELVCLTSNLMRNCAFIQLQGRDRHPYTPPWQYLVVARTSTATFTAAWKLGGADPGSAIFRLLKFTYHIHHGMEGVSAEHKSTRLDYILERSESHMAAESWDADIQAAYESTLNYLGSVIDASEGDQPPNDIQRRLTAFPMLVERRYVELVHAGCPRALVILAHYFAMLSRYEYRWWVGDTPVSEVRAIGDTLAADWQDLMKWPLETIEHSEH